MASREYYLQHREEVIAKSKKWANENVEKKRAIGRAYKERNREKLRAAGREYHQRNSERIRLQRIEQRFKFVLQDSRRTAKRRGYMHCTASEETIREVFTGRCFACDIAEDPNRQLCLDHCHVTGSFRGWLCYKCNLALGNVEDSIERLKQLITYLESV